MTATQAEAVSMTFRFRAGRRDDVSEADERYDCIDPRTGKTKSDAQIRGDMADEAAMDADFEASAREYDRWWDAQVSAGRITDLSEFAGDNTKEEF